MKLGLSSHTTSPISTGAIALYALVGNPNCGKTTVFNALTGLRQKVGNYPGVTVEKKIGRVRLSDGGDVSLIDLPGLYSLTPRSPDEAIARDILLGHQPDVARPGGVIHVIDASNLERNLYLTSQILDLQLPTVIVLTMVDVTESSGVSVRSDELERLLGVPVCPVIVSENSGLNELKDWIGKLSTLNVPPPREWMLRGFVEEDIAELARLIREHTSVDAPTSKVEAIGLLMQESARPEEAGRWPASVLEQIEHDQQRFSRDGVDFSSEVVESRYSWVKRICADAITLPSEKRKTLTDKIDRVVTHQFWGYIIFFGVMAFVFQTIFTWANLPMALIDSAVKWLEQTISHAMPPGPLNDLIVNGVIAGVGTTVTFLPQILLLFLFIALLEDTGYMARAAYLMDKIMSKAGLHGKSFIPLLSSFACAIPGIMATRTIDDKKSRLVTILVAPLMSCSARIPVYTLMIAAFIPARHWGIFTLPGLTMMAMYFLGMIAAFCMALLFKKTLLKGDSPVFFLEMPPYHRPSPRTILMTMLERAYIFLRRAGTVILSISIVLWFLSSYPTHPTAAPQVRLSQSYAGMMGRTIEPMIKPLGFDWRIGVSLVSSFVAREVFVSSMATIYSVGDKNSDPTEVASSLKDKLRADPMFSPLIAVCVMIYYVLAMQCLSTVAVVKRETNGWSWPLFMIAYMTALAWIVTFGVYRIGMAMHWGTR